MEGGPKKSKNMKTIFYFFNKSKEKKMHLFLHLCTKQGGIYLNWANNFTSLRDLNFGLEPNRILFGPTTEEKLVTIISS